MPDRQGGGQTGRQTNVMTQGREEAGSASYLINIIFNNDIYVLEN